jgi:hypothetical protein
VSNLGGESCAHLRGCVGQNLWGAMSIGGLPQAGYRAWAGQSGAIITVAERLFANQPARQGRTFQLRGAEAGFLQWDAANPDKFIASLLHELRR